MTGLITEHETMPDDLEDRLEGFIERAHRIEGLKELIINPFEEQKRDGEGNIHTENVKTEEGRRLLEVRVQRYERPLTQNELVQRAQDYLKHTIINYNQGRKQDGVRTINPTSYQAGRRRVNHGIFLDREHLKDYWERMQKITRTGPQIVYDASEESLEAARAIARTHADDLYNTLREGPRPDIDPRVQARLYVTAREQAKLLEDAEYHDTLQALQSLGSERTQTHQKGLYRIVTKPVRREDDCTSATTLIREIVGAEESEHLFKQKGRLFLNVRDARETIKKARAPMWEQQISIYSPQGAKLL